VNEGPRGAAEIFFVVSSGRSGTAMLTKALAADADATVEHEYMVHIVQPLAVRRYRGLADAQDARATLSATHLAAARHAETRVWGDSSNKLSWLIPDLAALFPKARFVHLVRDGRKVASSYLHKLGAECYDDRSTAILARHLADPAHVAAPPPEKKYWWPQPRPGDAWTKEFPRFDQFARIVWHWAEVNRVILDALEAVPGERKHFVRLEELRASPNLVRSLFDFLTLSYRDKHFAMFARPHNVNRPVDHPLDVEQTRTFEKIASGMMHRLGYAKTPEYAVNY